MMPYLMLFRWPNLVIIAITQYLFRYAIVIPLLNNAGYTPAFSHIDFFLLVLATILVSAAGYAINDYFDLRTDRINKPHKSILGKTISRRTAIFYHSLFNISSVLLGIYLSLKVGNWQLLFIFLVVPTLLWMYSIRYKRKYLVGNLIVGVLSAFVISIVWIFDYHALSIINPMEEETLVQINHFTRTYAIFAFLATLSREIIKDIEDIKGDAKIGCKTLPIVSGIRACKKVIIFLTITLIAFVAYFQIYILRFDYDFLFAYILLAIQIPFILLIHKLLVAKEKSDYRYLSRYTKFVMLGGIFSMLLFYFYFEQGFLPE